MATASSTRNDIFQNEEYLTPHYTPDQPVRRDQLLQRIREAVRPVTHRRSPEHVFLYGPAGTGKTTLATHLLTELDTDTRTTTVSINCWQYNTRSALLPELLIQLGYPEPRKGKPVDVRLAKLREWLAKHHSVIVALDEVDQLTDATEILYDLSQMSTEAATPLGLLLISDRNPTALDLDARSQSRLACHVLQVPPYDAADLYAILHQRTDQAFQPDTVPDEVLRRIAETVAAESGDCRQALTLLLWAGRIAEREHADTVANTHLQQLLGQQ